MSCPANVGHHQEQKPQGFWALVHAMVRQLRLHGSDASVREGHGLLMTQTDPAGYKSLEDSD